MIKNALISVSDKTGLLDFARFLASKKIHIISTGGTAKLLQQNGIPVQEISEFTGFPEMMDGRVKTLHPKVHGGLLHLRDHPEHVRQASEYGIEAIDLVVVNLYPFEQTLAKTGVTHEKLIENIDIGGPSMLRSASKNYRSVTVLVDPIDYTQVQEEIIAQGNTKPETREKLAAKVFRHTSHYDHLIATYLTRKSEPDHSGLLETSGLIRRLGQPLRYGENPHQKAGLYGHFHDYFKQLHGKELSYNNIIDISAAVSLISEFDELALAILKHTNPCGVAAGASLHEAWELAYATDKQAPFGGIIVMNRPLDLAVAKPISEIFSEVIIAPSFTSEAMELLCKKKNLRLMENHLPKGAGHIYDYRSVPGGLLVQDCDNQPDDETVWKVVTKRQPAAEEKQALRFGWKVVKHVKSNAIVYSSALRTLGIGAGQMSRVDSSKIAVWKAGEAGLSLKGSCIASDAFFPFADGILAAAEAGAVAAIQPGGSVRDAEVIEAADKADMAMIFTGRRHFRH